MTTNPTESEVNTSHELPQSRMNAREDFVKQVRHVLKDKPDVLKAVDEILDKDLNYTLIRLITPARTSAALLPVIRDLDWWRSAFGERKLKDDKHATHPLAMLGQQRGLDIEDFWKQCTDCQADHGPFKSCVIAKRSDAKEDSQMIAKGACMNCYFDGRNSCSFRTKPTDEMKNLQKAYLNGEIDPTEQVEQSNAKASPNPKEPNSEDKAVENKLESKKSKDSDFDDSDDPDPHDPESRDHKTGGEKGKSVEGRNPLKVAEEKTQDAANTKNPARIVRIPDPTVWLPVGHWAPYHWGDMLDEGESSSEDTRDAAQSGDAMPNLQSSNNIHNRREIVERLATLKTVREAVLMQTPADDSDDDNTVMWALNYIPTNQTKLQEARTQHKTPFAEQTPAEIKQMARLVRFNELKDACSLYGGKNRRTSQRIHSETLAWAKGLPIQPYL